MIRVVSFIIMVLFVYHAKAQNNENEEVYQEEEPMLEPEIPAETHEQLFMNRVGEYCSKNYPEEDIKAGIGGRVYVSFIIEKDGSTTNFKILKGLSPTIDKVAIEAIKYGITEKWKPAMHNGVKVRQIKRFPIKFNI